MFKTYIFGLLIIVFLQFLSSHGKESTTFLTLYDDLKPESNVKAELRSDFVDEEDVYYNKQYSNLNQQNNTLKLKQPSTLSTIFSFFKRILKSIWNLVVIIPKMIAKKIISNFLTF